MHTCVHVACGGRPTALGQLLEDNLDLDTRLGLIDFMSREDICVPLLLSNCVDYYIFYLCV